MPTVDHVVVLLAIRDASATAHAAADLASATRLRRETVDRVLGDLTRSDLLRTDGSHFQYAPAESVGEAIDLLRESYRTRPVTLIRAIYARARRAAASDRD